MNFTPQDRARQETLDWLNSGTSDSLAALLKERDRAAKEVRHGPRTKGTEEVQMILKEPSYRSVEKLHSAQRRTGMTIRYGAPGAVAYNFSKSLGWNRALPSQLPSLQLRDFQARIKETQTAPATIPVVPFSPIDWLVLSDPTASQQLSLQRRLSDFALDGDVDEEEDYVSSPISEPGGWRDCEQMDITDSRPRLTLEIPVVETAGSFHLGGSGVEEDKFIKFTFKLDQGHIKLD
ncbi:hypothetical protein GGR51DRAFT_556411 [Nemania sp. FL0031]|nr:hypothetical protein GGR51DRAFT_556411 [Nemania sp. FL0031]